MAESTSASAKTQGDEVDENEEGENKGGRKRDAEDGEEEKSIRSAETSANTESQTATEASTAAAPQNEAEAKDEEKHGQEQGVGSGASEGSEAQSLPDRKSWSNKIPSYEAIQGDQRGEPHNFEIVPLLPEDGPGTFLELEEMIALIQSPEFGGRPYEFFINGRLNFPYSSSFGALAFQFPDGKKWLKCWDALWEKREHFGIEEIGEM